MVAQHGESVKVSNGRRPGSSLVLIACASLAEAGGLLENGTDLMIDYSGAVTICPDMKEERYGWRRRLPGSAPNLRMGILEHYRKILKQKVDKHGKEGQNQ